MGKFQNWLNQLGNFMLDQKGLLFMLVCYIVLKIINIK